MTTNGNKYFNVIVARLSSESKEEVTKAYAAAIVYMNTYEPIERDKKELIMSYFLKDVKQMDEYANSFTLDEEEKEVMMYEFETFPEYIHKYEALAHQLFPTKEKRKSFIEQHKRELIEAGIKRNVATLYRMVDNDITIEDANYVAEKLISKKLSKPNLKFVKSYIKDFIAEVESGKIKLSEDNYDTLTAFIILDEIV